MPQIIGFANTRTPAEKKSIKQPINKLFILSYLQNIVKYFQVSLMRCKWQIKTLPGGSSQKFSIRQIERIAQIDKLPPGSQNIVKYF